MTTKRKIMIVAGEASGDAHAARLIKAIRDAEPETVFQFFGSAGPQMRDAGVDAVVQSDDLSVVGVAEIAGALPMFLRASKKLKVAADERKPDVVVLVDFPDFNLKLAKWLKKHGFTVVFYISPQLWAWRKYRISTIRKYVDLLLTILPFEKAWYASHGVGHVEYVGNPLANEVSAGISKQEFCDHVGLEPKKPIIALLPGSRHKEIVRILPVMLETAAEMTKKDPELQFVIAVARGRNRNDVDKAILDAGDAPKNLRIVENETYNAVAHSDAAAVTSGTATLETGILGTPLVIVYATSALNYALLKPLIAVEHYGLINLIAGKKVAKELIQNDFSPATLSAELFRLLDPAVNAEVCEELRIAREKLGSGGASQRATEAILKLLPIV
ncbi:MAG TPA: lipid-A-disaccharide synthase [Pyrinomonadaceae bacterium]|nr:lipid-A-disaccharide synthase [Pyrinomonadaceae bacterium]